MRAAKVRSMRSETIMGLGQDNKYGGHAKPITKTIACFSNFHLEGLCAGANLHPTIGHGSRPHLRRLIDPRRWSLYAARAPLPVFFFRLLLKKTEGCSHRAALVIFPEPSALLIKSIFSNQHAYY